MCNEQQFTTLVTYFKGMFDILSDRLPPEDLRSVLQTLASFIILGVNKRMMPATIALVVAASREATAAPRE